MGGQMISHERDIWSLAQEMIRTHQDDAAAEASFRAFELLYEGDSDGSEQWQRVAQAIEFLGQSLPLPGQVLH